MSRTRFLRVSRSFLARTASWKTLLERIEKRGRFPDSGRRYFTSDHKRSPIERELRHYLKAHPQFWRAAGERHGHARGRECGARAGKLPWRRSDHNSRAGRSWFDWLPIFGMTETQVFAVIRTRANRRIRIRDGNVESVVCVCVMASRADLRTAARLQPALYRRFVRLEERIDTRSSPTRCLCRL